MPVSLLELFFSAAVVAFPVWLGAGWTEAAVAALLVAWVHAILLIWKTYRLEQWLSQSDLSSPLPWKGVWSEIAQRIQRLLRQREKQTVAAEQRLQYFLQAIQASPNGVTLDPRRTPSTESRQAIVASLPLKATTSPSTVFPFSQEISHISPRVISGSVARSVFITISCT